MQLKKSKFIFAVLISVFITSYAVPVFAETDAAKQAKVDELTKKIEELEEQAAQYRAGVLQKQGEANTLKKQIDILNGQLGALQAEIGATENKIVSAQYQLSDLETKLNATQRDIEFKKAAIAQAMSLLYQHDQVNTMSALINSGSISEFASQSKQIQDINEQLTTLLAQLKDQKKLFEDNKAQVEKKKTDLEDLSEQQKSQKDSLSSTKGTKDKLLKDTKGQESKYQQLLTQAEKDRAKFFAELQALENAAVQNGTVITHVTAKAVPAKGTKIFQYPYTKYKLTQGYGMTSYAKQGAYGGSIHNGIDIVCGFGCAIHPIGSGTVLAAGFNNGFGNWVAIEHDAGGGMVSIYGHMQKPASVHIGAAVTTETTLGFEGSTGNSTGSHCHLSLYKDFFTYINAKNGQLYFNYADGSVNPLDYIK